MKTPDKFREYVWLVETIRKARRITFAEIQGKWLESELSEGLKLSRTTFNRHKDAIEIMFGIFIDCDRTDGYRYYIGNDEVLCNNTIPNWMLSTLAVNNIISESLSLQDRILPDKITLGGEYLMKVIEAMKQNFMISIRYRRYGTKEPRHFLLEPYCLKMFKQRWYILGHFQRIATIQKPETDCLAVFSFDRITEMTLTKTTFSIRNGFNAKEYFQECYGVVVGDGTKPEKIILRAFSPQNYYMNDLPVHSSQRKIVNNSEYTDFELYLRPTKDFKSYIMSHGWLLKVMHPKWLADEIHDMHLTAAKQYE